MKIEIVLLAGFLGAGKTTVLNELIRTFSSSKLGMLVNDFGDVPVDGSLLKSQNPSLFDGGHKIYEIGNGSIFCSCLKAPFVYGLQFFASEKPEILFIEASGMSDPSSMDLILKDHGMDGDMQVTKILTLVDPVKFPKLVRVLNVIPRQVEAADVILINKADLASDEEMKLLKDSLREFNREAPVQTGSFGRFDYSFLSTPGEIHRTAVRESCNTPDTRPASLFLEGRVISEKSLREFLDSVRDEIFRLKGFFELDGIMTYVSDTGAGYTITPVGETSIKPGLTVLCPPGRSRRIADAWQKVRTDIFEVANDKTPAPGRLSGLR